MGYNNQGQLAGGLTANRLSPQQVFTGAQAVAVGEEHTATLKSDGTVWTAGDNSAGQLADGTFNIYTNGPPGIDRSTLQQVFTGAQAVAAGRWTTGVLKSDGFVWMAGSNGYGNLGDGTRTSRVTLKQIFGGCQALAMDQYHSAILTTDGKVFTAGGNDKGQLADGSTTDRNTLAQVFVGAQAVALGGGFTGVLKTDGTVWTAGDDALGRLADGAAVGAPDWSTRATLQQVFTGAQAVSFGHYHTGVLKSDGTVWTSGWQNSGRLADTVWEGWRDTLQQVITGVQSAHFGGGSIAVVKSDDSVWAAGSNTYGALGDGTQWARSTFRQVVGPPQYCQETPDGWESSTGATCERYSNGWCTPSGGYGSGWYSSYGVFDDWAVNGISADEACCQCGGGQQVFPTTSERISR
jgi:alpha-tubulin suppressor-like RCC1 family protein